MRSAHDQTGLHASQGWWQSRLFILTVLALSALPLLWPEIPPLVDLPGHIGRYRVELDLATSPELQRYFTYDWQLIGNLGVDLLILPFAPLIGLEPAVKLIVIAIPVLTTAGLFWVAKEIHGEIPPTALFAVPFAYSYPFNFGFVNFALSTALALLAFAYWLRLSRLNRYKLRAWLFVPISCLIWLTHAFGWGVLGLLAFSAELFRFRDLGRSWPQSVWRASTQMLILAVPVIFMFIWRTGAPLDIRFWFSPGRKIYALISVLRDRWLAWDCIGLAVVLLVFWGSYRDQRLRFSRSLGFLAFLLALTFVMLPYRLFGSAYADTRLAPLMLIVAILAIRSTSDDQAFRSKIAWLGAAFLVLRILGNTVSFGIADFEMRERLTALNFVPRGAAVLTLSRGECGDRWGLIRLEHLGGLVTARKNGFSNNHWQTTGSQLLNVNYPAAEPYHADPSMFVFSTHCIRKLEGRRPGSYTAEAVIDKFPRAAFDYVWLLDPPEFPFVPRPGLKLLWRGRDSALYQIER